MALDIPSYLLGRNAGGGGSSIHIATEISPSSTNDEAAGAKAVYDNASYFAAANPSDFTLGTTHDYVTVPLQLQRKKDDVCSISNNIITFNKNVDVCIVSACFPVNPRSVGDSRFIRLEKNGSETLSFLSQYIPSGQITILSIPATVGSFAKNDTIKLQVYGSSTDTIYANNVFLNIVAIGITD